jgi:hypothetical protein
MLDPTLPIHNHDVFKLNNNLYRTTLSGTYTINDKEISFKNAQLVCVTKNEGETIFSVIVSELDNYCLDVYGKHFIGTIRETKYENTLNDPHSMCIVVNRGGKTVKWNPETQSTEEFHNDVKTTHYQNELDWIRQIEHENFNHNHKR